MEMCSVRVHTRTRARTRRRGGRTDGQTGREIHCASNTKYMNIFKCMYGLHACVCVCVYVTLWLGMCACGKASRRTLCFNMHVNL